MSFKTSISCFWSFFKKFFLAHKVCLLLYIDFLWFLVWQNFDLGSTVYWDSFTNRNTRNYLHHGINITTNQRLSPTFRGNGNMIIVGVSQTSLPPIFFSEGGGTSVHMLTYRRTVKSILLIKKFWGLVEMTFGLVNASFSLPEWQAVHQVSP